MSVNVEFGDFNITKCNIKITPAMPIHQIVEQACKAFKLENPSEYRLLNKNVELQGSDSVRIAGLVAGLRLKLTFKGQSTKDVTVGLQTEENGRLVMKFKPQTTLWSMLLGFEQEHKLNLTRRETNNCYFYPVCIFMNQEVGSITDLQKKTLMDLGLASGSGGIRLIHKTSNRPISDFIEQIEAQTSSPIKNEDSKIPTHSKPNLAPEHSSPKVPEPNKPMPPPTKPPATKEPIGSNQQILGEPLVSLDFKVFKPAPTGSGPQQIQLPDSFFRLSALELKNLVQAQKEEIDKLENRPLMTKAMREREQQLKEEKYPKTMIRIKFPNEFTVQATFYSGQKIQKLYEVVQSALNKESNIVLYTSPPKEILNPDSTFWKAGLAPASLVYINTSTDAQLKSELMDNADEYPIPEPVQIPENLEEDITIAEEPEQLKFNNQVTGFIEKPKKKLPKWLKLSK